MKSYRIGLFTALTILVLALCVVLIFLPSAAIRTPSAKQTDTSVQTTYLLKEHHGQIGAFAPGESEPFYMLETPLAVLPKEDQAALFSGIQANSKEELMQMIEDFEG